MRGRWDGGKPAPWGPGWGTHCRPGQRSSLNSSALVFCCLGPRGRLGKERLCTMALVAWVGSRPFWVLSGAPLCAPLSWLEPSSGDHQVWGGVGARAAGVLGLLQAPRHPTGTPSLGAILLGRRHGERVSWSLGRLSFRPQQSSAQTYLPRLAQVTQGPGPASQPAAASPVTQPPPSFPPSLPPCLPIPAPYKSGAGWPPCAVLGPLLPLFVFPQAGPIHPFIHSSIQPVLQALCPG